MLIAAAVTLRRADTMGVLLQWDAAFLFVCWQHWLGGSYLYLGQVTLLLWVVDEGDSHQFIQYRDAAAVSRCHDVFIRWAP